MLVAPSLVLVDWIVHHFMLTWPAFFGMGLILVGFGGFVVSQHVQSKRNTVTERHEHTKKIQVSRNQDDPENESLLELPRKEKPKFYTFMYKYLV